MYHRILFDNKDVFFHECDNYKDGFYVTKGHYKVGDIIEFRFDNVSCMFEVISILPDQEELNLDSLNLRKMTYEELELGGK